MTEKCLICGRPVPDYKPVMCCSGQDCSCGGQPIDPCVCSSVCCAALMVGIGESYEQRRVEAGIPLWQPVQDQFLSSMIAKTLHEN